MVPCRKFIFNFSMNIFLKKFGSILISRQSGKEAYAAFLPTLTSVGVDEKVIVDFEGVNTFSPSWGDEFLTPLQSRFGERLTLTHATNPSVALTIKTLDRANNLTFQIS